MPTLPTPTFTKKVTKADVYNAIGKTVYDDLKDGRRHSDHLLRRF